jgi:hypothetical protein
VTHEIILKILKIIFSDFRDGLIKIKNEKRRKLTDWISSEFNQGISKNIFPSMKIIGRRKYMLLF